MAKVSIKSEKITPFGGIFHVRELFPVTLAPLSTTCWVSGVRQFVACKVYHQFLARLVGLCQHCGDILLGHEILLQVVIEL